jgi:hypothetical protein
MDVNLFLSAEGRTRTGTVVTYPRILSPVRLPIPPPRQKKMKAATGFEPVIKVLQTSALPLGYAAILRKERKTGLEPATPTLARWCSTTELLPQFGWASWIRTSASRSQSPLPYRLAIAQ